MLFIAAAAGGLCEELCSIFLPAADLLRPMAGDHQSRRTLPQCTYRYGVDIISGMNTTSCHPVDQATHLGYIFIYGSANGLEKQL